VSERTQKTSHFETASD